MAEDRLRDTQRLRAVGQLAGGVAHEANNQMLVVLGAVHFLLRRGDLPGAAQNDLLEIRQAAERTAAITQQLLAFGRRQALKLENIDVNRIVARFETVLRRTLTEHQELILDLSPEELVVRVDPQQLDQVLLNLTLNARDAMPDGGCLTVRTLPIWVDAAGNAAPAQPTDGRTGHYACLVVEGHRTRHGCGDAAASLGALFHHQRHRPGNWSGPLCGGRHRQPERRVPAHRQRAG
jgi:Signal transduction histidine kinase regulating C4-dicarboxylate transport system